MLQALQNHKRELLNSGRDLIDLSMINPDVPPARVLVDRLTEAVVRPMQQRYAVSRGIRKLREAFSQKYAQAFNVHLDPETAVCVTMGAKDAFLYALMCLNRKSKCALVAAPAYPAHISALNLAGYSIKYFQMGAKQTETLENLEVALQESAADVVVFNFPNNPTGQTVSADFWTAVVRLAQQQGTFVINDFVYGEMGFTSSNCPSLLAAPDASQCAAEIYSMSKAYSVPGWRVGALLGNTELVARLAQTKAQVDYGIFLPIQNVAAFALTCDMDLVKPITEVYQRRAQTLSTGLAQLGFEVTQPKAGCSVWARMPKNARQADASELAMQVLNENGLAILPGAAFGPDYQQNLRFALVCDEERLRKVVEIISKYC